MKPIKIILDTDMGSDCDDAAALAVLHELANEGKCEILAVTHCYQGRHFAGCIDAINRYYGHPDIPVGVFSSESNAPELKEYYAGKIHETFPNRFRDGTECPDTVDVLRKALSEAGDGEVTLAVIGSLYSMCRLMESGADDISDLSGMELIERKIARTVIMGGRFREHWPMETLESGKRLPEAEFNIRSNIPAARTVCEKWPGELVFCSYEIGCRLKTGAGLQKREDSSNPVGACYRTWHANTGVNGCGRESWDPATALYAVCPDMGLWKVHGWGKISVDEKGVTVWKPEAGGKHAFLVDDAPAEDAERAIDGILDRDLKRAES
ncbi:MAG: nucleoside hydrolase [Clostridia bacterium]|nr:nucleoside hydrolase [Clostridia bacterium]